MKNLAEYSGIHESGWYVTEELELFEIPLYGGEPRSCGKYDTLEEAQRLTGASEDDGSEK
jgi:hypothetical protein